MTTRRRRPRPGGLQRLRAREGLWFIVPWVAGFVAFVAWPLFFSLWLSFNRVNPAGFSTRWTGLQNFARAFVVDIDFLPILLGTVRDVVLETPVLLVFSLAVAILLNKNLPGRALLRALFFLPVVIGSGYVMQELLGQGVGGLSVVLGVEGGPEATLTVGGAQVSTQAVTPETPNVVNISAFLNEFLGPQAATGINEFLNRLGLTLWRSGIQILLFLAGLHGISQSLYDAGRIDGANEWTLFWTLTLPMISPIIVAVLIFSIVDSFTDVFNEMLPYIRQQAFAERNYGYSAALSWIYFGIILALILAILAIMRRRIFYQGQR